MLLQLLLCSFSGSLPPHHPPPPLIIIHAAESREHRWGDQQKCRGWILPWWLISLIRAASCTMQSCYVFTQKSYYIQLNLLQTKFFELWLFVSVLTDSWIQSHHNQNSHFAMGHAFYLPQMAFQKSSHIWSHSLGKPMGKRVWSRVEHEIGHWGGQIQWLMNPIPWLRSMQNCTKKFAPHIK